MVQRKRLKKKVAKPTEQDHSQDFAKSLEEYKTLEDEIKALQESIADPLKVLKARQDQVKSRLEEIVESAGVKKMETGYGMVTLVRPTRHEVNESLLKERLTGDAWRAITVTTTSIEQKKFEQAIAEGKISQALFKEAVKEVPASKGYAKVTIKKPVESEGAE